MKRSLILFTILLNLCFPLLAEKSIDLTQEELLWIEEHPVIRLAPDPFFAPMEFVENGEYKGMSNDYLKIIALRTGLNIEVLPVESWEETLSLLKTRMADINGATTPTPPRKEYLIFTEAIFESSTLIFGTNDTPLKVAVEDLKNKRVGIIAGYAEEDYMDLIHPDHELIRIINIEEALQALSLGRLDYFIGDISFVGFQIKNLGLTNIVIVGELDYRHSLSFAVRSDWPILRDILQKGLDTISEEERDEITDRWIGLKFENTYISKAVLPFIFFVIGLILLVLVIIVFWNRTLTIKIAEKTNTIKQELIEKELLLHEVQHRVNNNMQIIMSLLSLDSVHDAGNRISDKTLSRINVVAEAQERSQVDIKIDQIEIYAFVMDIIYYLRKINSSIGSSRIRLKETRLFCDLNTAVSLGLLLNEVLLNLIENEFFNESGCDIEFSCAGDHSLITAITVDERILSKTVLEGRENSQSSMIIQNMLDALSALTEFKQIENPQGPGALWELIIPAPVTEK